jgi:hypothetical protein
LQVILAGARREHTSVRPPIYAFDPAAPPDTEFLAGELCHLVVGNRGRLLDARRTPVAITGIAPERGAFEVEVGAFEDAGARWELPLEDVGRFQFAVGGSVADPVAVAGLERAAACFTGELEIACDPGAREEALHRIAAEREKLSNRLTRDRYSTAGLAACVEAREGDARLFALLEEAMIARGVADLERRFSATFASNPASGEFVEGHAIVLAELGLAPYRGKVVRDPGLFVGPGAKERRAQHIVARLAFTQALWANGGEQAVTLYRGAAVDGPLPERASGSSISATFSRDVATAHFEGGPTTQISALWRQRVPVARLFMTFLETRELNQRFKEAEAVLIGDPDNRAF